MTKTAQNISITKKPEESAMEVRAEIPVEAVAKYRAQALTELGNEVAVDGFRKGNVPEQILVKHVGEAHVMERTASVAISEELPLILAEEKVAAIETPKVTVTKLAAGNPIAFTALVSVMPEVMLPDYKAIARKQNTAKETPAVSDDNVNEMLTFVRRERAKIERMEKGTDPKQAHEEAQKLSEVDLPLIDDVFAQSLGAKNANDLKTRMRENMEMDAKRRAQEKVRVAIADGIIEKTSFAVPKVLVEHELNRMMDRLAHDVEHAGATVEAYLKSINKSEEDVRKEWIPDAEKHVKLRLIIREIAIQEKITPPEERVAHELEHLKEHHKDVSEADLRMHVGAALLPETVFAWLENQK